MGEQDDAPIRNDGLAFFGKVVAGQSHEVTNVLTIINELAGLQQDLLGPVEGKKGVERSKLRESTEKIMRQVERGQSILRELNRFAHSVDHRIAVFDVRKNLARIAILAERMLRLKRVKLVCAFPEQNAAIESDPFYFHRVVRACIDASCVSSEDVRSVTLGYGVADEFVEICVAAAGTGGCVPPQDEVRRNLNILLEQVGYAMPSVPWEDDRKRFLIRVPR